MKKIITIPYIYVVCQWVCIILVVCSLFSDRYLEKIILLLLLSLMFRCEYEFWVLGNKGKK